MELKPYTHWFEACFSRRYPHARNAGQEGELKRKTKSVKERIQEHLPVLVLYAQGESHNKRIIFNAGVYALLSDIYQDMAAVGENFQVSQFYSALDLQLEIYSESEEDCFRYLGRQALFSKDCPLKDSMAELTWSLAKVAFEQTVNEAMLRVVVFLLGISYLGYIGFEFPASNRVVIASVDPTLAMPERAQGEFAAGSQS